MTTNEPNPKPPFGETVPAQEGLERLISENLYLFGHGTVAKEIAASTIKDGLHANSDDLFSTVTQFETLVDDPDALEHDMELINKWPHHDLKYVVILGVERLKVDEIPHRMYLQSIVQFREGREDADELNGLRYTVDPRFVAGYFDVKAGTFVGNRNFDPHYDPELLKTTANFHIQRELNPDPVDPREHLGGLVVSEAAGGHEIPTAPPNSYDGPDVW